MSSKNFNQGLSPEWYAKNLLHDLNIKEPPINAKEIAEMLGIKYREEDLDNEKVDGALYRKGDKALIAINSRIAYQERKNFSTAHELGHYVIKSHGTDNFSCSKSDMETYGSLKKAIEAEANRFASALLMPDEFIKKAIKGKPFCFETLQNITTTFKVSLSAAALRFAEFSDERCAVILSQNGEISWSKYSKRFNLGLRRGKLQDKTYAYDAFTGGDPLPDKFEQVYPEAWIAETDIPDGLKVYEHSTYFKNINAVLSLIKIEEEESDEWEDED